MGARRGMHMANKFTEQTISYLCRTSSKRRDICAFQSKTQLGDGCSRGVSHVEAAVDVHFHAHGVSLSQAHDPKSNSASHQTLPILLKHWCGCTRKGLHLDSIP
eukprot:3928356-Amphidinium_carterae.1